jgi:hypothetical protein
MLPDARATVHERVPALRLALEDDFRAIPGVDAMTDRTSTVSGDSR